MKVILFLLLCLLQGLNAQGTKQILLEKLSENVEAPVYSISLYSENNDGILIDEAVGLRKKEGNSVAITDQFRIASSTKLFVATIVLQLKEEGKLKLSENIYPYLKDLEYIRLEDFHFFRNATTANTEQKRATKAITIKQLLSHRSGLADIFNDRQEAFFNRVMMYPNKQYQPKDVVDLYFEFGLNKEAKFKPGDGWHYSDMNYVLLGLLIEKLDKKSLSQSIRDRIIGPLDMKDTYFEFYEKTHSQNGRVHQYVGSVDFNEVNTSFDWSGGGLVSTHQDLAVFIKTLFEGKLISEKSLDKMIAVQPTLPTDLPYGLGIYQSVYNGHTFYGHYGFYGTYIGYCPDTKTILSYCISQATPAFNVYEFVNYIVENVK